MDRAARCLSFFVQTSKWWRRCQRPRCPNLPVNLFFLFDSGGHGSSFRAEHESYAVLAADNGGGKLPPLAARTPTHLPAVLAVLCHAVPLVCGDALAAAVRLCAGCCRWRCFVLIQPAMLCSLPTMGELLSMPLLCAGALLLMPLPYVDVIAALCCRAGGCRRRRMAVGMW